GDDLLRNADGPPAVSRRNDDGNLDAGGRLYAAAAAGPQPARARRPGGALRPLLGQGPRRALRRRGCGRRRVGTLLARSNPKPAFRTAGTAGGGPCPGAPGPSARQPRPVVWRARLAVPPGGVGLRHLRTCGPGGDSTAGDPDGPVRIQPAAGPGLAGARGL